MASGKEEEKGGYWGWSRAAGILERLPARPELLQRSAKVEKPEGVRLPWPRFSGHISVRGGTGREGEGKWESAGILGQVAIPREGWSSGPLANQSNSNFCLQGVCGNGRKKIKFLFLKISNLGNPNFG
jgi:hypothetical protein